MAICHRRKSCMYADDALVNDETHPPRNDLLMLKKLLPKKCPAIVILHMPNVEYARLIISLLSIYLYINVKTYSEV